MEKREMASIRVSIARQELTFDVNGKSFSYPVSTALNGIGFEPGSFKTPTGMFRIAQKIGANAQHGTVFVSRLPVGVWPRDLPNSSQLDGDLVLSRILWLDGLEEQNSNTYDRYIYIHGTNHEGDLGTPSSHGCIRMANQAIIELFDMVDEGTLLMIEE